MTVQARLRLINGEIALAIGSGNRCQAAINLA